MSLFHRRERACRPPRAANRPLAIFLWAIGCLAFWPSWPNPATAAPPVDYLRDIQPILKTRCYACHGALQQQGGLRTDTGELLRRGGDDGGVVVPGRPDASRLVARVAARSPDERMPPEGAPLSDDQIARLRAWIADGARSPADEQPELDPRRHWAFQAPRRTPPPAVLGGLLDAGGVVSKASNPIDAFVNASLAAARLTPRPEAERAIVLRRVTLDLIGLPPTPDELHAYLADDSPAAYERVVERLLNDPRHGERWGRHWMDVWRYSDWYGRRDAKDVRNSASQIWRWRDWIVRSLNHGRGYDRMVQEMLAADELCPEDYDAGVATGYLIRNYFSLNANEWMRSVVEHTGKAFLGLTFNCAHCHDHKYDPIAHDDYFRLRAFFEPIYIRQDRVSGEADPGKFQDYTYSGSRKVQRLGAVRVFDKTPEAPTWFYTGGDERNRAADRGSIRPGVPAFLADTLPPIEPVTLPLAAWYPGARPEIRQTALDGARAALRQAEAELAALGPLAGESSLAAVTPAAVTPAVKAATEEAADSPNKTPARPTPHALAVLRRQAAESKVIAAGAELAGVAARLAADAARYRPQPGDDLATLARDASRLDRQAAVKRAEHELLVKQLAAQEAEALPDDDANRRKAIDGAAKGLKAAAAALDKARAATTDDRLAETYSPLTPQYPATSTGRRLALARWITGATNPLTARVAVNQVWMRHFHSPLVASVADFGRNGARPTHPELLDWLAVEFQESGWDMKRLHRLIVTSDAYRRVSSVGDAADNAAADPENRLLWRMNSHRMESELVRDSLLACGERLDQSIGGVELENSESLKTWRRSLYYSVHPESGGKSPLGELFDAPDPLECYRRTTSIVPQQALALANSPLVHQLAASIVAASASASASVETSSFVTSMFERILGRRPSEAERRVCLELLEAPATAPSAAAPAAARESLVRILLNHNDFVTIR